MFADTPEEDKIARNALSAYEEKHSAKGIYQLEGPYVIQSHKKRQVTCEIQETHCVID